MDFEKLVDQGAAYVIVNEAGASIYSASEVARAEFPDLDVTIVEPNPAQLAECFFAVESRHGHVEQDEVHRVYHQLDDIGVRLAHQIAAYGYSATMQPNEGDIPLVAFAQLAGLGEVGKHGSLISPKLGASFRLGAVTTDMPLAVDGPKDHGIDEICVRCGVCTRFCPGDAIKPVKKRVNGVERWHVDTPACEPYFHRLYGCKICLMVCPLNAKGKFGAEFKKASKVLVQTRDAKGMLALIEERTDMHYEDFIMPDTNGNS